ncbi:tRNA lysidine(34) synthetase TilS [Leptolyngbya sp. BL0902]|uniref:tRNA lysidine(34) synthetase TilS n=1 Tax=Leptolyngbya sp. BL0902 TaxID=1115757 RepID=UPI001CECF01E|nr:tRNA lysidine(34) synthetase TilS [Leptolyngbya sp. BL0902]
MERPPWSDLHARLHRELRQRALLPQGAGVVVAVSGGQDSIALLRLLLDLQPKWQWRLWAMHGNHGWRPDAAENAAFVADLCQAWGVPCQVVQADPPPTSEAEARAWRYNRLGAMAQSLGATHIATGHTATDRAETLLYNLLRGSGTDGLQALAWKRPLGDSPADAKLTVVRPLLAFSRQTTGTFCRRRGLPLWVDSTNADLSYTRNRLRLEVFPYLKAHIHPRVEHTLAQTAEILTAEVALLDQMTDDLYRAVVKPWAAQPSDKPSLDAQVPNPSNTQPSDKLLLDAQLPNPSNTQPPLDADSLDLTDPDPQLSALPLPLLGVVPPETYAWRIQRSPLRDAPLALQRRVLRRALQHTLTAPITFDQVEKLVTLVTAPNRSQTDPFPGGWVARVEGDYIQIQRADGIITILT